MTQVKAIKRAKVGVRGVVQGVGFRPFVYNLAIGHQVTGWVRNTSGNVEVEIEGSEEAVDRFLAALEEEAPPMARIESIEVNILAPKGYAGFEIRQSLAEEGEYQLVSPDIATCQDCQDELLCPQDRRYRYPFINCTNCGPRFTIIEDIPYDRPKTTMRRFKMCPECQREYDNPLDRRFHAQPNACPICGPSLELVDNEGRPVACDDVLQMTSRLLRDGKIVAIKGLGGFHLACDASNEEAIRTLRARKRRLSKPLAVMMATLDEVRRHCSASEEEEELMKSPSCPIVLLPWKRESSHVSPEVAPALKYLGVMLPYTPLHHVLLRETGLPLVMTSGNLSEEPIAKDNDEALLRLGSIADYFLLHNRDIYARYDDSVYMVEQGKPRAIRRARSYAPYPIHLPFKSRQILACGAELKNTFCLAKEQHAFLSQHIGDMENEETLGHFEDTIELYEKLFRVAPEVLAYDMHPEYLATKYALESGSARDFEPVPVQHHHAHIVSCLVENGIDGPAIGVAFDGTGYGSDGRIWGGEFLVADWKSFERVGHLEYVPMPGGEAAIVKPYRMALGYLCALLGEGAFSRGLPFLSQVDSLEIDLIKKQVTKGVNSPLTSSCGRLFDAVSAIAGIRSRIEYEAQAAIELEMIAFDDMDKPNLDCYPFSIVEQQGIKVIELGELISAVVHDAENMVAQPTISVKFHQTIAQIVVRMCQLIASERGLNLVALSGGVFQNRLLLRLMTRALNEAGFDVLAHRLVPCNDGGLSLGQAVIAHFATSGVEK